MNIRIFLILVLLKRFYNVNQLVLCSEMWLNRHWRVKTRFINEYFIFMLLFPGQSSGRSSAIRKRCFELLMIHPKIAELRYVMSEHRRRRVSYYRKHQRRKTESTREKHRERHQRAGRIPHHPSSTCFHPSRWPLTSAQPPSNTHTHTQASRFPALN